MDSFNDLNQSVIFEDSIRHDIFNSYLQRGKPPNIQIVHINKQIPIGQMSFDNDSNQFHLN